MSIVVERQCTVVFLPREFFMRSYLLMMRLLQVQPYHQDGRHKTGTAWLPGRAYFFTTEVLTLPSNALIILRIYTKEMLLIVQLLCDASREGTYIHTPVLHRFTIRHLMLLRSVLSPCDVMRCDEMRLFRFVRSMGYCCCIRSTWISHPNGARGKLSADT